MKKKDTRFLIIFVVIVTLSLLYLFQSSYAKYRKQISTQMSATIASWNIKVNNELINNKTTLTNNITPVLDANTYIKEGVLAPGSTGYFDIIMNAEDVDVDFNYEIQNAVDADTPLEDLTFTGYSIDSGTTVTYPANGTISGSLTKNTGNTTVRIFFTWDDSVNNSMDNQADTEYALDEDNINTNIVVTIHFTQRNS